MNIILLLIHFTFWLSPQKNAIIATVNGEPIHENELKFEMYALRTGVYTYFVGKYPSADDTFKWRKKYGDEIPEITLQKRALHKAIRIKFQQTLMKKYCIQKDISYTQFQIEFKHYTDQRAKAIAHHEIVYGPPQTTESEYYSYIFSNNLNPLLDSLKAYHQVDRKNYQKWLDSELQKATIKIYPSRLKKVLIDR